MDANLLKKMGLTQAQIEQNNVLFFIQLLLPIVDSKESGIAKDPCRYPKVSKYTNTYSIGKNGMVETTACFSTFVAWRD